MKNLYRSFFLTICLFSAVPSFSQVDTLLSYPEVKPYYFEIRIETPTDLYKVAIKKKHGLSRGWIYAWKNCEPIKPEEIEALTDLYLPDWQGNFRFLDRDEF